MKFDKKYFANHWGPYTIATCSAVLLYFALTHFHVFLGGMSVFLHVTYPVIVGLCMAYIVNPLEKMFERFFRNTLSWHKAARWAGVAMTVLSVILVVALLMTMVIPQVIKSVIYLVQHLSVYVQQIIAFMETFNETYENIDIDVNQLNQYLSSIVAFVTKIANDNVSYIIRMSYRFGANLVNLVISFFIAIYILLDKDRMLIGFKNLLRVMMPDEKYGQVVDFLKRCHSILIRFIVCDIIDGVIVGVVNGLFMSAMGMPYIQLISVVVGVTNLAPTFGPIVGGVIGGLILLLVNPWYSLGFVIFTLVLQTIDGYVIKPRLFGESLGVSSVWILIAIVVGGRLFGVMGILMGIPFAAIISFSYRDLVWPRLKQRKSNTYGESIEEEE